MRTIERTGQFKRDYKREVKGVHRQTLESDFIAIATLLANDRPLPEGTVCRPRGAVCQHRRHGRGHCLRSSFAAPCRDTQAQAQKNVIALDTNVLVRYLAQDDVQQSATATRFIENDLNTAVPGFISLIVLVETCWVLQRLYAATGLELLETVADLLGHAHFQVERRAVVQAAVQRLRKLKSKADFADHLIVEVARMQGCTHTVSFDKVAVRSAGMLLLA